MIDALKIKIYNMMTCDQGRRTCSTDMHDCALERKRERNLSSAPRVEHTGHCLEIN